MSEPTPPIRPFRPSSVMSWVAKAEATPEDDRKLFLRFGPDDYGTGAFRAGMFFIYSQFGPGYYSTDDVEDWAYAQEPIPPR